MKHLPTIAGILLGLLFLVASVPLLFNLIPPDKMPPPPPEGTPAAMFFGAFATTGYLTFIKVLELLGALLVMIPKTRNLGQLVLGPIIVNILAFHAFIAKDLFTASGLFSPMMLGIVVLSLYLLWVERRAWAGLVQRQ